MIKAILKLIKVVLTLRVLIGFDYLMFFCLGDWLGYPVSGFYSTLIFSSLHFKDWTSKTENQFWVRAVDKIFFLVLVLKISLNSVWVMTNWASFLKINFVKILRNFGIFPIKKKSVNLSNSSFFFCKFLWNFGNQ